MVDHLNQQGVAPTALTSLSAAESLKKLEPDEAQQFVDHLIERAGKAAEAALLKELPSKIEEVLEKIGYTDEVKGLLSLLVARSGDTRKEVLRKALLLYGVALNARNMGNHLAILTPMMKSFRISSDSSPKKPRPIL